MTFSQPWPWIHLQGLLLAVTLAKHHLGAWEEE